MLQQPYPECGFDAATMALSDAARLLTAAMNAIGERLSQPRSGVRPEPTAWSPLEYACHVRDTCDVFRGRIALVLAQDNATFPNWDQDATAVERRYDLQDPATVGAELQTALTALLGHIQAIPADGWDRPAVRSNGSPFTLASLLRYLVHDPVHHAHDVGATPPQAHR